MTKMKIGTGDWIVVCDGRKALILENLGDRMFPNLHTKEVHEHPDPSTPARKEAMRRAGCINRWAAREARSSRPTGMMSPNARS